MTVFYVCKHRGMLQVFEDVCTINELKAMACKFQVAKMLHEGNTYQQIEKDTGASTHNQPCETLFALLLAAMSGLERLNQETKK